MEKNIVIVGGDKRNLYLSKLYEKENYKVNYIKELEQLNIIEQTNNIIGPIPFTKDGENIYTENSKNKIPIKQFIHKCHEKTLIAGAISKNIQILARENKVKIIDLMNNESLAVLNTIATAEGAIEIAIKKTEKTIHGSNVLILGYGRVGKVVAKKFARLSANVTVAARREEIFAWIEADGYKSTNINELGDNLKEYDIIINTPPTLILDKEKLRYRNSINVNYEKTFY